MADTPLGDVTVVDFTHARAGPWCTQILAELGAEVIKVERPGTGDSARRTDPKFAEDVSFEFVSRNRNKRSVVIDLKADEGRALAEALVADADVLVENFGPGALDRLGLGYEYLSEEVNPELVYASIKGYGGEGPHKDRKGVDLVMQAEGGLMSVTGPEDGEPVKVGQAIGDIGAGLYSAIGILSALHRRERTGKGQKFETDLFGTIVSFMEEYLTLYGITGEDPTPFGSRHQTVIPYEVFETADGKMALFVTRWEPFVTEVIGDESLLEYDTTELRQEHYGEIMEVVRPVLRERTTEEWMEVFDEYGFPCGPLNRVSDVVEHPQARERGYVYEYDDPRFGEVTLHGHPMHFSDDDTEFLARAPTLGEHTDEVLEGRLGLSEEEIEDLRGSGAIE